MDEREEVKGTILEVIQQKSPKALKPGTVIFDFNLGERSAKGEYIISGSANQNFAKKTYISNHEGVRIRTIKDRFQILIQKEQEAIPSVEIEKLREICDSLPGTRLPHPNPHPETEPQKPEEKPEEPNKK